MIKDETVMQEVSVQQESTSTRRVFAWDSPPNKCKEDCKNDIMGQMCSKRLKLAVSLCDSFVQANYDKYSKMPDLKAYYNQAKQLHDMMHQTLALRIFLYVCYAISGVLVIAIPISTFTKIFVAGEWDYLKRLVCIGFFALAIGFIAIKSGIF